MSFLYKRYTKTILITLLLNPKKGQTKLLNFKNNNLQQDFVVPGMNMVKYWLMINFCLLHRVIQLKLFVNFDYSQAYGRLMGLMVLKLNIMKIHTRFWNFFAPHFHRFFHFEYINLQCNRLLLDGGVLWSSNPAEPLCKLKCTGPDGG